jgi:hypothetical protein
MALIQPPHWIAEVVGVLVRRRPGRAAINVADLFGYIQETRGDPAVYLRAVQLVRETGAHIFDTLYHAVALQEPDGLLITADHRYYELAHRFGRIARLDEYRPGVSEPGLDYVAIARRALA